MSIVGSAIGIAALIGAGTSVTSAVIGSKAASKASKTQAEAADKATQLQSDIYYNNVDLQKPWYQAGESALSRLMGLAGLQNTSTGGATDPFAAQRTELQAGIDKYNKVIADPKLPALYKYSMGEKVKALQAQLSQLPAAPTATQGIQPTGGGTPEEIMAMDPGYQFRMDEGTRGVESTAAAKGGVLSGGTQKALERYRQGYASNEFQNVWNRLAGIAGVGQQAANQTGALGANYANNASDTMTQAANARASGYVGGANAWSGAVGNIGQSIADIYASRSASQAPIEPYQDIVGGIQWDKSAGSGPFSL
jgi:hypothetical protein